MLPPRDPDYVRWEAAFAAAFAATIGGALLLASSDLDGVGGILRGIAGLALIVGAAAGFRHFWLHKV